MNPNDLEFYIGERVELVDSDERVEGIITGIWVYAGDDESPYHVEFDDGEEGWYSADELSSVPSPEQLAQFAQLVERVYAKLSQENPQ